MSEALFSYTFCFIESLLIFWLLWKSMPPRYAHKKQIVISVICVFILSIFIYYASGWDFRIKTVILLMSIFVMSMINYKGKVYIHALFSILSIYILLITDIFVTAIFTLIFKINLTEIFATKLYSIMAHIFAKVINALLILVCIRAFKRVSFDFPSKYWISLNIITVVNLIISIILVQNSTGMNEFNSAFAHYLFFSMAFLSMSIVVLYYFIQLSVSFRKEKQDYIAYSTNNAVSEQIKLQNAMMDSIKKINHDIKNDLVTISMLLEENRNKDAVNYINEITDRIENVKNIVESDNFIVDAVINCKSVVCESYDIPVELKIGKIPEIDASYPDISAILSNVFDNAIEASLKTKKENRFIQVNASVYKGYASFIIKNRYDHALKFENGLITTTKNNSSVHGFGMSIIKEAIEKNNGVFKYSSAEKVFTVNVLLPIK